jgi:EmrB/QacA subfamily drug resistance transporter
MSDMGSTLVARRAPNPDRAGYWVLALASVASFMVALDALVVTTALGTIRLALHASVAELEWTINAYTLTFAAALMTAAVLGDRFGRRRVFTLGLGVFTLASAACAVAPGVAALIAARAVQGIGAAMVLPLAMALVAAQFPPQRRGWAMGIFGAVTGLAVGGGPVVGGAVTQGLSWPWIFWLNVPVGLAAIPLTLRKISESHAPRPAAPAGQAAAASKVDVGGAVLVTVAGFALVWALVRADAAGWGSAEVIGTLALAAVAAVAFVAWEQRTAQPMLPMILFRSRGFAAGNAVAFLLQASLTGSVFFMAQFQQVALGQDALHAGLRLLPWTGALFLVAPRAGKLADRIGDRPLIAIGLIADAAGLAWLALVARPGLPYPEMIAPMVLAGAGISMAWPAAQKAVVTAVAPARIGQAAGAFQTARQLGGAVGVAVSVAVFAAVGGYASAAAFSSGFTSALGVCAALALAGALAGLILPARRPAPAIAAVTPAPAAVTSDPAAVTSDPAAVTSDPAAAAAAPAAVAPDPAAVAAARQP